jgi:hypothetical protein
LIIAGFTPAQRVKNLFTDQGQGRLNFLFEALDQFAVGDDQLLLGLDLETVFFSGSKGVSSFLTAASISGSVLYTSIG